MKVKFKDKNKKSIHCIAILLFLSGIVASAQEYTFWVAGHAYGAHSGGNVGLHPPFLKSMQEADRIAVDFLILTGDIVNVSNAESWMKVQEELDGLDIESFYVMGNHDQNDDGYEAFIDKHGATYYSFMHKSDLFVVLNSTIQQRSISSEQVDFLEEQLNLHGKTARNIFLFFHEVLWNSDLKYKEVRSNSRSRYDQIRNYSNFWEAIFPLLRDSQKRVVVFAGDVAGNQDAIPAFYDVRENVILIASGMGEVEEENFLVLTVTNDSLLLNLNALNNTILPPITYYSVPDASDTIFGDRLVEAGTKQYAYTINPVHNAETYEWSASSGIIGQSDSTQFWAHFDDEFEDGEIRVRSLHDGFGASKWYSATIAVEATLVVDQHKSSTIRWWVEEDGVLNLDVDRSVTVVVYTLLGHPIMSSTIPETTFDTYRLNLNKFNSDLLIIAINGKDFREVFKLNVRR